MDNYIYNKNKFMAIIPARSGSKSIPDKNIKIIAGLPLLAYSIKTAVSCDFIEKIIVSTDSPKYAKIAADYGAQAPFLRPPEISQDNSLDIEYLKYTLSEIGKYEALPEFVILLRPTTPLRKHEHIKVAIDMILKDVSISAVVSVSKINDCPYKWMILSEKGYLKSPFADMKPDDVNLPRQSFCKMLYPDGYVDVLRSKNILENDSMYGLTPKPYFTPIDTIDIDEPSDLIRMEELLAKQSELN